MVGTIMLRETKFAVINVKITNKCYACNNILIIYSTPSRRLFLSHLYHITFDSKNNNNKKNAIYVFSLNFLSGIFGFKGKCLCLTAMKMLKSLIWQKRKKKVWQPQNSST